MRGEENLQRLSQEEEEVQMKDVAEEEELQRKAGTGGKRGSMIESRRHQHLKHRWFISRRNKEERHGKASTRYLN